MGGLLGPSTSSLPARALRWPLLQQSRQQQRLYILLPVVQHHARPSKCFPTAQIRTAQKVVKSSAAPAHVVLRCPGASPEPCSTIVLDICALSHLIHLTPSSRVHVM